MTIDLETIVTTTRVLEKQFDWVLIEGAGGLLVPLTDDLLFIDYLAQQNYPLLLVTSPRLGSINHTLMSLEIIHTRGLNLAGLVYNLYDNALREIVRDSQQVFEKAMGKYDLGDKLVILPKWPDQLTVEWDKILPGLV
jgi:dethiobiotin synthetase